MRKLVPHGDDHSEKDRVSLRTVSARMGAEGATGRESAKRRFGRGPQAAYLPALQVGVLGDGQAPRGKVNGRHMKNLWLSPCELRGGIL